jgi:hypothetical protein
MKTEFPISLIKADLLRSERTPFLNSNRIVLEAIVQRFAPNGLFRITGNTLIIVTSDNVYVEGLARELHIKPSDIEVRDYNDILDHQMARPNRHKFSIIIKTVTKKDERESPVPLEKMDWWFGVRADKAGFRVLDAIYGQEVRYYAHNTPQPVREIHGVLEITDPDKFNYALLCGMGRQKSLGFGLLLLDELA